MLSKRPLTACLALLALPLAASACVDKAQIRPLFPPAADVKAAIEPKPVAPPEILTSEQAAARYDIEVESWGERLNAAGGRICRWVLDNGGELPFTCPPRPTPGQ